MKTKFYSQHHDGADYIVTTIDSNYGSSHAFETFSEAKTHAIRCVLNDIDELRSTLKTLRKLKKADVLKADGVKK